jgi:hypothetical protein
MQAVKCSIETLSIPAQPALAPESNVAVRVANSEATMEEKGDDSPLPFQIAQHQETQEITQTDMEDQGSGAGEIVVGVLMAES